MSEWFMPTKLAGLPGLPTTDRGVRKLAEREGWKKQKHSGRGGGYEYHVSALPKETRAALLNAALGEVATKAVRQETQLALVETNRQQLVADARQGVLHALDLMMARTGYSRKRSITLMLDMARLGQVEPQLLAMLKMARDPRGRPSADGLPSVRSLERFLDQAERGALV
ncbi:TPA: DNA-binding protein, partial [Pseudomonas aeruginosa]